MAISRNAPNIGSSITGFPSPGEGSSGDIQLRLDRVPKIFSKIGRTWYQNPLFTPGNGIEKTSLGLAVQVDGKSMANFGKAIRLGKLKADPTKTLRTPFAIKEDGEAQIDTRATGADVPLRITNDGTGYSQIIMGGANPEIKLGFAGSGGSVSSSIAGTSKISFNLAGAGNIGFTDYARAGAVKFSMGNTYQSSIDEFRLVYDGDPRVDSNAGIRMDRSGNIGFRGAAPAAAPDYTISNLSTDRALDCDSTSTAELADVLGQLITDLIAIGLLQ